MIFTSKPDGSCIDCGVTMSSGWATTEGVVCWRCGDKRVRDSMQRRAFLDRVLERMKLGAREYGDQSFDKPFDELLVELEQEALDLAGWGFVVWEKIQRVRELAKRIDQLSKGKS